MSSKIFSTSLSVVLLLSLLSCASYKQNIMFQLPKGQSLQSAVSNAEQNYTITRNDLLAIDVYTNDGERIIDPDKQLLKDLPSQSVNLQKEHVYLVTIDGTVKLPMVGLIKVEGLTIRQAEEMLQKEFSKFYHKPLVVLSYKNKRVVVLGVPQGVVVPLVDENVTLVEVLALSKAVTNDAKVQNIRVLRGEEVLLANLSTIDGYRKGNITMQPGDIVYVEPVRRPLVEGVRDYGPVFSLIASISTLVAVLIAL